MGAWQRFLETRPLKFLGDLTLRQILGVGLMGFGFWTLPYTYGTGVLIGTLALVGAQEEGLLIAASGMG
jgi:hypothetical protein